MMFHVPNQYRVRRGELGSDDSFGNSGAFLLPSPNKLSKMRLKVIASDGTGWSDRWEHVSVSTPSRTPTWEEMSYVKDLFWDNDDCVMQLHPPKSQWVNDHPYCLHLWRPTQDAIPMPPRVFV